MYADKAASWDNLHERFEVTRISYQKTYGVDGACADMAEGDFACLRYVRVGIDHHVACPHPPGHPQGSSCHEDNRHVSNGEKVNRILALPLQLQEG